MKKSKIKIGIIGLGYVGLPLAVAFSKKYETLGFDISEKRIRQLNNNIDITNEVSEHELSQCRNLTFTNTQKNLSECNVYIVTVPTPIDEANNPDVSYLVSASKMVGSFLARGDVVVFESTVYPGATEEVCVPRLEEVSGLKLNTEFFVGYSPERINPGDKSRPLHSIVKITSGSDNKTSKFISDLYSQIIDAGIYEASTIKVAEAAKVIENSQRDLNIAFVNELAKIFDIMQIDTSEVIEAASTKWNFQKFQPGLVGGHCIGVDPYYLTHKASSLGYHPEVILAGRRINDTMSKFVAEKLIKNLIKRDQLSKSRKVLIAGCTFKENCPDIRNSKVFDLCSHLTDYGLQIDIYEPNVQAEEIKREINASVVSHLSEKKYSSVVLAVPHHDFITNISVLEKCLVENGLLFDLKAVLPHTKDRIRL